MPWTRGCRLFPGTGPRDVRPPIWASNVQNARRTSVNEKVRYFQLHEMPTAPYGKVTHLLAGSA
jgi:hypothetical protein